MSDISREFALKLGASIVAALVGVWFLLGEPLTMQTLWRLLPGALLLAVGGGASYYYYSRLTNGDDMTKKEQQVIEQAQNELRKEETHDKSEKG